MKFRTEVLIDVSTMSARVCNAAWSWRLSHVPSPAFLFSWNQRALTGQEITSFDDYPLELTNFPLTWMIEAARFLGANYSEYRHDCVGFFDHEFHDCLKQQEDELEKIDIDVSVWDSLDDDVRDFRILYTTIPIVLRIAIPRDRAMNDVEIMLLSFRWHVWFFLVVIFGITEVVKLIYSNQFKNDPILLVVCGFERRSLHRAALVEKITLQSLMVVMFFLSHAFETKIVSLMISRPSIQRIRNLDDLAKSDIIFYEDLISNPEAVNDPIVGKETVYGKLNFNDADPNAGLLFNEMWLNILDVFAYDYERMQPWYVILEDSMMTSTVMHRTSWRNPHLEVFRYIHSILVEAGVKDVLDQLMYDDFKTSYVGRRPRDSIEDKVELDFTDIRPAWMVLVVGLAVGVIVFVLELAQERVLMK